MKVCLCVKTFEKIIRFAMKGGMDKATIKKIPKKAFTKTANLMTGIKRKRRTAKQIRATKKLIAFNKRRRARR